VSTPVSRSSGTRDGFWRRRRFVVPAPSTAARLQLVLHKLAARVPHLRHNNCVILPIVVVEVEEL
jgi:hypothetical protein